MVYPEELKEELERYNLKPVTVVIGEDGKGNLRITRGLSGGWSLILFMRNSRGL